MKNGTGMGWVVCDALRFFIFAQSKASSIREKKKENLPGKSHTAAGVYLLYSSNLGRY